MKTALSDFLRTFAEQGKVLYCLLLLLFFSAKDNMHATSDTVQLLLPSLTSLFCGPSSLYFFVFLAHFIFSTNHPLRLQANRDKNHSLDKKLNASQ